MFEAPILDTRRFIACADQVSGTTAPDQFPVLTGNIFSGDGEIRWSLTGRVSEQGIREVEIRIAGELWLMCRRCLSGLRFPLESSSRIRLVSCEEELPELDDEDPDIETLVMPDEIRVADWISEEVVLALPLAPSHSEGECQIEQLGDVALKRDQPFAALAVLKRESKT